jgi:ferritin-like metal-binding protein YciE
MIRMHIVQTEQQIRNLEQVFSLFDRAAERTPLESPRALVADGEHLCHLMSGDPAIHDGAIAAALAKVEAYEVACYRGLLARVEPLGRDEVIGLLRANLDEEEQIAQLAVNYAATLAQRAAPPEPGEVRPTDRPSGADEPHASRDGSSATATLHSVTAGIGRAVVARPSPDRTTDRRDAAH